MTITLTSPEKIELLHQLQLLLDDTKIISCVSKADTRSGPYNGKDTLRSHGVQQVLFPVPWHWENNTYELNDSTVNPESNLNRVLATENKPLKLKFMKRELEIIAPLSAMQCVKLHNNYANSP